MKRISILARELSTVVAKQSEDTPRGLISTWGEFLSETFEQVFSRPTSRAKSPEAAALEAIKIVIPQVSDEPQAGAEVRVVTRLSETAMHVLGDPLINEISRAMRLLPELDSFEGEEVVTLWLCKEGKLLPSALPSIGARAQGGYLMYMAPIAHQEAHQHGIRISDGSYYPNSGSRFLIGLIGADHTTIRHKHGVYLVPRGSVVTIEFRQKGSQAGAAHQFWNDGGKVGNVFLSLHCKDFLDFESEGSLAGQSMMNLRTYHFSAESLAPYSGDTGFKS